MAALRYAAQALDDLDRLATFLARSDPAAAAATLPLIVRGLSALEDHPLLGRPIAGGLRELVLSRGKTGYVALYRYIEAIDTAIVLAIRHQREAGFFDENAPNVTSV